MFKIGEFSKLSQVSVKTLRYYADIGLLEPADVDRFTSYRYYSASQLPRLNRILALKDLGLSLEQIGHVLDDDLSSDELRGMLRLQEAELQQRVEEQQGRLARVAARLKQIEQEGKMPAHEVVIKDVPAQHVAALRGIIDNYGAQGNIWSELVAFVERNRLQPIGPCLTVYYDTEYKEKDVDVEVCLPVSGSAQSDGRSQVYELPAATVASLIHEGSYDNFSESYGALMAWIEQNSYRIAGPNREIYIRSMDDVNDPAEMITEIQFPVVKA